MVATIILEVIRAIAVEIQETNAMDIQASVQGTQGMNILSLQRRLSTRRDKHLRYRSRLH
jgi:hypothetical protein